MIDEYCRVARSRKHVHHLRALLDSDLSEDEATLVRDHLVLTLIDLQQSPDEMACSPSSILTIHLSLDKSDTRNLPSFPLPEPEALLLRGYGASENSRSVRRFFRQAFYATVSNALTNHATETKGWLNTIGKHTWQRRFTHVLHEMALELAEAIREREIPAFSWPFTTASALRRPSFEERDEYYFGGVAESMLLELSDDLCTMRAYIGQSPEADPDALAEASQSEYFNGWRWLSHAIRVGRPHINRDTGAKWVEARLEEVWSWPEPAATRAESLAELAHFATLLRLRDMTGRCVDASARHLLAYGYHKDMTLFQAIDVIRLCSATGIADASQFLKEVAQRVSRIGEITDGDETNYLPKELASLLALVDSELLLRYYQWLADTEQFDRAEHAFGEYIRVANLLDPVHHALIRTAVDDKALEAISCRAREQRDSAAKELEGEMTAYMRPSAKDREPDSHRGFDARTSAAGPLPSPKHFPPDTFADFVRSSSSDGLSGRASPQQVRNWMEYWSGRLDCREVVSAVGQAANWGLLGFGFNFMPIYEFVLHRLGAEAALPWLIRDSRASWGWNEWGSRELDERKRWVLVKSNHPDDWKTYMLGCLDAEALGNSRAFTMANRIGRLAKFLAFFNKQTMVRDVLDSLAYVVRRLTDCYAFEDLPWWSND